MRFFIVLWTAIFWAMSLWAQSAPQVDFSAIAAQLEGDGLGGRIHASVKDQGLFVFTWRHPKSFFVNVQMPITSNDPAVLSQLKTLRRHDYVVLQGSLLDNDSPLKHLRIDKVLEIKKWEGLGATESYDYEQGVPEELFRTDQVDAKVHSVSGDGAVLVIEYKDRVFPVFNPNPALAKDLFRNDKIILKYKVRSEPFRPAHLEVRVNTPQPIVVYSSILDGHGDEVELEGALVMFPQSPQIRFNIFAVQVLDIQGHRRNYTLTTDFQGDPNFSKFTAIREFLQKVWDNHSGSQEYFRNKFINKKIMVRVRGQKNVQSPNQANPQVFIGATKDLKVVVTP